MPRVSLSQPVSNGKHVPALHTALSHNPSSVSSNGAFFKNLRLLEGVHTTVFDRANEE